MNKLILALIFSLFATLAQAQTTRNPCYTTGAQSTQGIPNCVSVGTTTPLPVTGNSNIPTYSAALVAQPYSVAGDIYCINGSATKTVKVKGIRVSAISATAVVGDVSVILRSTLDTGGGLLPVTVVAMDQNNPTATATVNSFTSLPSLGTAIGTVRTRKTAVPTAANTGVVSEGLFQFSVYWDQPLTLRGATQQACVNVSAFGTGTNWDIDHEHTEE